MIKDDNKIKFGRVAIIGRPNTGKSTLLNSIMQQKVAITSHLPQTTRKIGSAIFSSEKGKILFLDTPGVVGKVEDLLGKRVNTEAPKGATRADVIVCLVDISRPKSDEENKVIGIVRKAKCKKILVYNKIDIAKGPKDHLADYNYLEEEFDKVIAISAIKETNIKGLINIIFDFLPEKKTSLVNKELGIKKGENRPVINMASEEFVAELIREKAYLFLREEVPYTINVEVVSIVDKKKIIVIKARILTNAERYKKMIIGKGGKKIKEIGYNARKELELMSGRKIFLGLEVVVDKHWQERLVYGI